jgi:endonuclease-3
MATPNRAALISKTHKVLKQHFSAVQPDDSRPLLEQMLFACCLENAHYDAAEKVYARLKHNFFDWNEVRVSTVTELAEAVKELAEPTTAASNLKKLLQSVFESTYSFDLEPVKKQNIGAGIKRLQQLEGATPFVVAYAVQASLAGHSIPLDRGALAILGILGIASQSELASGNVAGLERAIAKNKGVEFGSLLHQLAADYIAAPHSPKVKKILVAIRPDATIPKRVAKADERVEAKAAADGKPAEKPHGKQAQAKPSKTGDGKALAKKPQPAPEEKVAGKPPKVEKSAKKASGAKRPVARNTAVSAKRKSATKQLSKKKPR